MRTLHLLALTAALVVPAAAAHAQIGVYAGPSVRYTAVRYAAPEYGPGFGARIHWDHRVYGRPYVTGPWIAPPVYGGFRYMGGGDKTWVREGHYARGRRW